jgi:hypothetical protein
MMNPNVQKTSAAAGMLRLVASNLEADPASLSLEDRQALEGFMASARESLARLDARLKAMPRQATLGDMLQGERL